MLRPRYRWRTWLRSRLPFWMGVLFPKGRRDCGAHEWYRSSASVWECYHCTLRVTECPWTVEQQAEYALQAAAVYRMLGAE